MKMKSMRLKNFRGYNDEVEVSFSNLTAFVGKNDVGKSSVLEALDIFFNDSKGTVKLDSKDINMQSLANGDKEIVISVSFEPSIGNIIIDSTNQTTLKAEYLLNLKGELEIIKKYPNGGAVKVYIKANHPTNNSCKDLLSKKNSELSKIIDKENIFCTDKNKNAIMREAIWNNFGDDLQLSEVEIDVSKIDEKSIWDKLKTYLPLFILFQSDRKNTDNDSEVQDPLSKAVERVLDTPELKEQLKSIADEVEKTLKEVSNRTLEKIREMNPEIANSLNPVIPSSESLKWAGVFKNVSIAGDENISINKRGSGVKRLILLNFFRAEAELRKEEMKNPSIIYAIEEPETSQHTENQKLLTKALLELSEIPDTQVIITTHSANIVKQLDFQNLCLISSDGIIKKLTNITSAHLPYSSLNEVNFLAFEEISEEYHNELFGFIEAENQLPNYRNGKPLMPYIRIMGDGTQRPENKVLTEYIRHQIHHPENRCNPRFSDSQLQESINLMRNFICEYLTV